MPTEKGRSRSRTLTAESLLERLEQIFESDVEDAGLAGAARRVERYELVRHELATLVEHFEQHHIANLLQEAIEEGQPDKKLPHVVLALGLLMGSLNSPPRK